MLLDGPAWNADVNDDAMNAEVDQWLIRQGFQRFWGRSMSSPHDTAKLTSGSSHWAIH